MLFEDYVTEEEYLESMNELIFQFIDSLDLEQLTDEQAEYLDYLLSYITDYDIEDIELEDETDGEDEMDEAKKKRVVRAGKVIRKIICKKGYKAMGGRCIKMNPSERRVRKKAARRSARARKGKKALMMKHRARSMRISKRIRSK